MMGPGLRTAASGMVAQQLRVEVISNNLANVNTAGFKRSRAQFEDLLYQMVQGPSVLGQADTDTLPAIQVGRGVRTSAVQRIDSQGPIEPTGRPLDLAIEGEGFFQVRMPDGSIAYTRDGGLSISDQGLLVTSGGYGVMPGVAIPPDASQVSISRSGVVTAILDDVAKPIELGRIELARFANPPGLLALGENLLAETTAAGPPVFGVPQEDGFGRILQGALEASNVEIVQEMVDMIAALRAYEISSKAIQVGEQMSDITNAMVR